MQSTDNKARRFIQYNLWKNCRNGCEFCFNRGGRTSTVEDQLEILDFVIEKLNSQETDSYNELGFIGGEFFDNQLDDDCVKQKFYQLFDICAEKYRQHKIDKVCVATSLIFDASIHLIPFIQYIDNLGLSDIVLFCTSYDTKYRFHSDEDLAVWCKNMTQLRPLLKNDIHTEMIVSSFFIDDVQSGKLNLNKFCSDFQTSIDFIEPTFIDFYETKENTLKLLSDFFPTRKKFINFVKELCFEKQIIDIDRFLTIKLRSDTSYYQLCDKSWVKIDNRWQTDVRRIGKDGKPKQIYSYSDSDKKMTDDILLLSQGVL